jgi:hypothetical protein
MSAPPSDLVRDAASLMRFIRSVCYRKEDIDRTHRPATNTFFQYLSTLERKTGSYLQRFIKTPPNPLPVLASLDRENLLILRGFWNKLHEFAKPVRDADTLHAPVILIDYLEKSLSRINGLRGSKILVYHTARLNYLQHPRGGIREGSRLYASIVNKLIRPRIPSFPSKHALVAIPYSQDTALFSNLLLCHELGHFVFEEFSLGQKLAPHYKNSLRGLLGPNPTALDVSWCTSRLASWSEEIFCDRFAIALMGPAAAFSYIELFDLVGCASAQEVEFYHPHPSDACRLYEQFEQLKSGGWWPLLDKHDTKYAELIRRLHKIRETRYVYNTTPRRLAIASLRAFERVRPKIAEEVKTLVGQQQAQFHGTQDSECVAAIHKYLGCGVVPATLVKDGKRYQPDPVLLINAAYLFYLRDVPDLIAKIKDGKPNNLDQRTLWGERVELWTLKAMEDLSLPSARPLWGA